jgi:3-isopropylmalate/(R)-2-methylmalate dehydratase large subunit
MGMTMTQKILAHYAGKDCVKPGEFINCDVSMVLGHDLTAPIALQELERFGIKKVHDPSKIALVPDHFCPNKDIKAAENIAYLRRFAKEQGIENFFEVGEMGIEHALLPEKGLVVSGDVVIGADSHTCTYGALGAFATGVGSTDMAASMASGKCWFKVPSAIKFNLKGKLNKDVSGKDVILYIIGMISVSGALYQSMEFAGDGVSELSMDDRFTIANMAIEAGAKNGIFPVDEQTLQYVADHSDKKPLVFAADDDAEYAAVYDIDLGDIPLTVACPHLPENTKDACDLGDIRIDQCVIGSCTNGRISDLEAAARVLDGRKVKKGVRALIFPATQAIYMEALERGYIKIFMQAGCAVSTPTCGPCLGGHMGILAAGEVAISTTNRNFVGRMGHVDSKVYLSNPAVAAASAVTGYITCPDAL